MAQKTEKEDAEIKTTLTPCIINNISLASTATTTNDNKGSLACFSASSSISELQGCGSEARTDSETKQESVVQRKRTEEPRTNRCSGCRRKVGLTGFRCRCGDLFCSEHRYSDRHGCSYDYKTAAKAAISRENPVVKASKIVRI